MHEVKGVIILLSLLYLKSNMHCRYQFTGVFGQWRLVATTWMQLEMMNLLSLFCYILKCEDRIISEKHMHINLSEQHSLFLNLHMYSK